MIDHHLEEQPVEGSAGGLLKLLHLLVGHHPGHAAVTHTGH
jgi:hypothetical protein